MRRMVLVFLVACSPSTPPADAGPTRSSPSRVETSPTEASSVPTLETTTSAPATSAEPSASSAPGSDTTVDQVAEFLEDSGATRLCEERVYPQGGRGHLTWWGYASKNTPKALLEAAAKKFPRATRDDAGLELTFQPTGASRPTMILDLADAASPGDLPKCKDGAKTPAGTKTLIVLSTFPEVK